MTNRAISFLFISTCSILLFACAASKQKSAVAKKYSLSITNPSSIERADELVVLSREMLEQKTGKIGDDKFVDIATADSQPVIVQFDDLDKDGKWDELAFLQKFEPNQKLTFSISETSVKLNKAVVRAHVRMRKKNEDHSFGPLLDSVSVPAGTPPTDFSKHKLPPYLTEGPAWENDKVAFRLYMDTRNTKDIFGKTTAKMVMDTVGVIPENSYHTSSEWGMDILAVGKSLGAGSLALRIPGVNGKDSLVRLGGNNVGETTYEKVADGPVRAIFRMHYNNWQALSGVQPIKLVEEISIWGGKFFYQSRVTVIGAAGGTKLVTGIVNLKSKKSTELNGQSCEVVYTYDVQSENKDKLGLAVMVHSNQFAGFGKTPNSGSEILNTYTVSMPLSTRPSEFRFYSGWELSDLLFTNEDSFRKFLNNEAMKYSAPLVISW
ncbi:MAG: hypothetical protein JWQ40_4867 [Segetibacter sp.]|nr:hypothetical protein [Segetibacter sp.]